MNIKRSKNWTCGYCSTGDCAGCRGAVRQPTGLLVCGCRCLAGQRCITCGETENVLDWACADPQACADTMAARRAANPLTKELETVRMLGGQARQQALAERTMRQIRTAVATAVARGELDDSDSASNMPTGPRPAVARGICICGCDGPTKGGRFQPGHDMKLKGQLKRAARAGDQSAVERLRSFGWPVPEGVREPELAMAG